MTAIAALVGQPVIAGAGLAGLTAALQMQRPCVLLSPKSLGIGGSSALAQGGIASAIGPGDTPGLHARDTIAAGAGLCDRTSVEGITAAGPAVIRDLIAMGVQFDLRADGTPDLHLEAAHSCPRIAHARGDGTGAEIMRALISRVRATPRITVLENTVLRRAILRDGCVAAAYIIRSGQGLLIPTRACVIATGGLGALYPSTTMPPGSLGSGLATAARAGAMLRDMEFVQFHPTALAVETTSPTHFLISEAVRGAGAILIDETGARFTDELASRDVVARAITTHLNTGHTVFLDARAALGGNFTANFPNVAQACKLHGIDPDRELIPVRPTVHYHMGGIETNPSGRSTVEGLWACGEAASTGLHGANRLASNSLLEAFVGGTCVARDLDALTLSVPAPSTSAPTLPRASTYLADVRALMGRAAGILRHEIELTKALRSLLPHIDSDDHALTGAMVCVAALQRQESRGSHYRTDYPNLASNAVHSRVTLQTARSALVELSASAHHVLESLKS